MSHLYNPGRGRYASPVASSSARCLAVLGTASDVGKSLITAGIGRLLSDRGLSVAPFKAQNLSNNSGVTRDAGEIGRAQILQAVACRVEPHVDMNPVLLKPMARGRGELVLLGRARTETDANRLWANAAELRETAWSALDRLRRRHAVVLIEGAGSCAEVNLRPRDFVNFAVAHHADAPVLLVADIERGGVFAQVVGTLAVLPEIDRARVKAVVINRFRGDTDLFESGREYLERTTGVPVVGVVPYLEELGLDAEDAASLNAASDPVVAGDARVRMAVIRFPHLSNFTDFDPLTRLRGVAVDFLSRPRRLAGYSVVVLPGSKAVRHDLGWLAATGWIDALERYRRAGGRVLGICGGYQMMGEILEDPLGLEGEAGSTRGLGWLPVRTRYQQGKTLRWMQGYCPLLGAHLAGYEIHRGVASASGQRPFVVQVRLGSSDDPVEEGALDASERTAGTHLHGLFDEAQSVRGFLRWLGCDPSLSEPIDSVGAERERQLTHWAEHLRRHVDLERLTAIAGLDRERGVAGEPETAGGGKAF